MFRNQNFILWLWLVLAAPIIIWMITTLFYVETAIAASSLATLSGGIVASIAGFMALGAARRTIKEIRRQTDLPIKTANRDRLLTQKSNLKVLKSELRITIIGLKRLYKGADNCRNNLQLARTYMPFWLYFPKIFDLRKTTVSEVGVDFGSGGAEEFTKVREQLRIILRLNYSISRDAVGYLDAATLQQILNEIMKACNVAERYCRKLDSKLDALIRDLDNKLEIANIELEKLAV